MVSQYGLHNYFNAFLTAVEQFSQKLMVQKCMRLNEIEVGNIEHLLIIYYQLNVFKCRYNKYSEPAMRLERVHYSAVVWIKTDVITDQHFNKNHKALSSEIRHILQYNKGTKHNTQPMNAEIIRLVIRVGVITLSNLCDYKRSGRDCHGHSIAASLHGDGCSVAWLYAR